MTGNNKARSNVGDQGQESKQDKIIKTKEINFADDDSAVNVLRLFGSRMSLKDRTTDDSKKISFGDLTNQETQIIKAALNHLNKSKVIGTELKYEQDTEYFTFRVTKGAEELTKYLEDKGVKMLGRSAAKEKEV